MTPHIETSEWTQRVEQIVANLRKAVMEDRNVRAEAISITHGKVEELRDRISSAESSIALLQIRMIMGANC